MTKRLKNLFIGLGPGYHHQVRIMHSMVKNKCDSSMLFFDIEKNSNPNTDLPHMLTDKKSWEKKKCPEKRQTKLKSGTARYIQVPA